ncbi:MAG: M15 family metallopeptidase [Clostridia bacterium]|nr:M15 family metallopeptidase [Clostridia bacterium]
MLQKLFSLLMILVSLGSGTLREYADQMNLGGYLFLVNRDYPLTADYVPQDLVMPDVKHVSDAVLLRQDAAAGLEGLFTAAKDEKGFVLVAVSGYRSYSTQNAIFARKVSAVGRQQAMLLVAPPGCSEHQLGLAMDIGTSRDHSLTFAFGKTEEGMWVAENCWRFGFIIRYRDEWTDVTGYSYEPWHLRYVGVEHARRIHESDIPFEYYIEQLKEARFEAALSGL